MEELTLRTCAALFFHKTIRLSNSSSKKVKSLFWTKECLKNTHFRELLSKFHWQQYVTLKYNVYNLQFNNYVGFRAQTLQARSRSRSLLLTVNSVAMSLSLISDASFHCLWSSSTFCFTEIICTTNSELIQLNMQYILETRKAHNVHI